MFCSSAFLLLFFFSCGKHSSVHPYILEHTTVHNSGYGSGSLACMLPARYGGDACNISESETCPEGMVCSRAGICECQVGQMTSDRRFCLRYRQKLVGSSCTPLIDTCYQRAGQYSAIIITRLSSYVFTFHTLVSLSRSAASRKYQQWSL